MKEFVYKDFKIRREPQREVPSELRGSESENTNISEASNINSVNSNPYKAAYLNLFLKEDTVMALKWFRENGTQPASVFLQNFVLSHPTHRDLMDEKSVILGVLKDFELITESNTGPLNRNYGITPEGEFYLTQRGL